MLIMLVYILIAALVEFANSKYAVLRILMLFASVVLNRQPPAVKMCLPDHVVWELTTPFQRTF